MITDEIVKCEKCRFYLKERGILEKNGFCTYHGTKMMKRDDFCSKGVEKGK